MFTALALLVAPTASPLHADVGEVRDLSIHMSNAIVSDPLRMAEPARIIPGTIVDYSVDVTGPGTGSTTTTSFVLGDAIPQHMSLFVGDLVSQGSGPVAFVEHDSGLQFAFSALSSTSDMIEFSDNGGKTFDYVPQPDVDGFDDRVTHIRVAPRGNLLPVAHADSRFSLRYRMKVK
ncbi:MAG: hypothetical protein IBJ12_12730 [Sphingomonadaceae bacterium]|nr:hypothetical protein [Sphingomonadaceae bacterium]